MLQSSTFQIFQIKRNGFRNKIKHICKKQEDNDRYEVLNSKLSILPVFCRPFVKRRNFKNTVREEIGENIDFGSILMEPLAET